VTLGTYCTTCRISQSSCWCSTCLRRVGAACLVVTHAGARPGARPRSAATMTIASSSLSALRAGAWSGPAAGDVTHASRRARERGDATMRAHAFTCKMTMTMTIPFGSCKIHSCMFARTAAAA
jgi:hypothetical protein